MTFRSGRTLVLAALASLFVGLSTGESLAQLETLDESRSHRVLPPDAATLSRLQSQAALLYRLHQMVSGQNQLPGVTDPERQQRLQQIMQQMALKLGQSELQMPGPGGRSTTGRPGRSGQSRQGFQSGDPQPGQPRPGEPGFGTGASSTQSLRSFLEKISGGSLGQSGSSTDNGGNSGRFPWTSPPDRGTGYTRPGMPGEDAAEWQQAPDTSWQAGPSGTSDSPFDDATDSSLSLTERFTRIADRARVDSLGKKKSGGGSEGGGSSWLSNAGIQSALSHAIDGAARSVAEQTANGSSTEPGRPQPRGPGSENGGLQRIGQTAEWLGSLANRATAASESVHESMADATPDALSSSSFRMADLMLPMLLLGAAIGVLWWLQRRSPDFEADSPDRPAAKMPASIRTREDIVTAFHVIAARTPAVGANWWTHRRAALALVQSNPKTRTDVEALAELYEQARYLPENEFLTAEQLSRAGEAVRRIGRS